MKQNANDGIGSATAATSRKLAKTLPQTTSQDCGHSCPHRFEAGAKLAEMSALLALPFLVAAFTTAAGPVPAGGPTKSEPIPMDQIGAVAGRQYQGDGLSVLLQQRAVRHVE